MKRIGLFALFCVAFCAKAFAVEVFQIRLAFVPNGMCVSFATNNSLPSAPSVQFGRDPSRLDRTAQGVSHTYGTIYFHDVVLNNLDPKADYFYVIVGSNMSRPIQFKTAQQPGDATPYTVTIVGDMGLVNSKDTYTQINAGLATTDWFLHIGDISYADDYFLRPGDTYEGSWDRWQSWMTPVTQGKAYMVMPGNHEVTCNEVLPFGCPTHQRNFTSYRHRFRMPVIESGGTENMWYSFDVGLVHFIQISTETDFPDAPENPGTYLNAGPFGNQLSWLEQDLQKAVANRARVPWIVVSGHRPFYTSERQCPQCQKAFEPLFVKYKVDIFFTGHVHWYERCWPIAPGGVVTQKDYNLPKATIYITNGAAGNVEDHSHGTARPFTAFLDQTNYGFGRLRVLNSTHLNWSFYKASDGGKLDEITIYQQH